jgi:hypothetical protein
LSQLTGLMKDAVQPFAPLILLHLAQQKMGREQIVIAQVKLHI